MPAGIDIDQEFIQSELSRRRPGQSHITTQRNEQGKTSAWHWSIPGFKEGIAQNYTGQVFADYASGSLDEAGFVKTMQQVLESAYAN